jgi:hypothetical protein
MKHNSANIQWIVAIYFKEGRKVWWSRTTAWYVSLMCACYLEPALVVYGEDINLRLGQIQSWKFPYSVESIFIATMNKRNYQNAYLTTWSRIFLEKLTAMKFVLSQINTIHTDTTCLFKIQFFFCGERPRSRSYGRTVALRLIVQPCDEDD